MGQPIAQGMRGVTQVHGAGDSQNFQRMPIRRGTGKRRTGLSAWQHARTPGKAGN
ncbi:MAG: hypothetical protein HFH39_02800 [Lachnospiraceae bacterium]|nr:hypothetical protein [Lachnospiraceae bacterium]